MTKEAEEVPPSRLQTISHSEFSVQLDIYDQGGRRGSSLQITETISHSEFSIQLSIYDQGG